MDDMHQRLLHNINPFERAMPAEIRRKPLRSSQPSEELLLPSSYAVGDNLYENSGVKSYTSIPLRQFAPSSSSDIKHREPYISQREFLKSSAWRPGFWTRFPALGIATLVMAMLCTLAAIIIGIESNNKLIGSWMVSPSVLLSITSVLSNIFLSFGLAEGLIISFWRKSLHGSSLQGLHYNWYAGISFWGALQGGFRGRSAMNSLACILTVMSTLRGPLFQRASTPISGVLKPTEGNMTINLATDIPEIYGGISVYSRSPGAGVAMQTSNFTKIMQSYSSNAIMSIDHPPCGDSCSAKVNGFGFTANCSQQTVIIKEVTPNYYSTYFDTSVNFMFYPNYTVIPSQIFLNATWLSVNHTRTLVDPTAEWPIYETGLDQKICILSAGIVAYDIVLQNGTVQLQFDDYSKDEPIQDLILPGPDNREGGGRTVLGGFEYAAAYLFTSTAVFEGGNAVLSNSVTGALANQFMVNTEDQTFSDPTGYMINQMRQIAFRTSLQAAKDNATASNATQTIRYGGTSTVTIYKTNFTLIGIASALNILTIMAIIPIYRGWWELGRKFSMSPLEIAKAFDAPLLRKTESNATWREIARKVGNRNVTYGEITRRAGTGQDGGETVELLFTDAKDVRYPTLNSGSRIW